MSDFKRSENFRLINHGNYLINSYISLTRIKSFHFLFILLEILLNIFQELDIFFKGFKINVPKNDFCYNIVSLLTSEFEKISPHKNLLFFVFIIAISDSLYLFIKLKKFKINNIFLTIIINFLELFFFRTGSLLLFSMFINLKNNLIIIGLIFFIFHLYLVFNNFIYNHLYYFVPEFIDYPYDEFSSSFDIILLFIKLLLTISTNNSTFGKFCFLVLFITQIFFSFYFLIQIRNKSYLLMKNTFLNKTKLVLFFTKTIITILALIFGNKEIKNILFLIICIFILLTINNYGLCLFSI